MIAIVLTNPRHHAEILLPVVRELSRRGHRTRVVSLAEFRGFETPAWTDLGATPVVRAVPVRWRTNPALGADSAVVGPGTRARRLAQRALWIGALGPRLRWLLHDARAVIVPNDSAFPYDQLTRWLRSRRTPFLLVQEGIRFPLPGEHRADVYGKGGATVCAWGEGTAEHFRRIGVPGDSIVITGNPRFDGLSPEAWRTQGHALLDRLGLHQAPLLYLSNPVDDQGFCSSAAKLSLFATFVQEAAAELRRTGTPLVVKLHPREDLAAFRAAAAGLEAAVSFAGDAPLFALLGVARAAVVLASTVGLEALAFGVPLAALALPGHGFAFEYVSHGAAVGLSPGAIAAGVAELLGPPPAERIAAAEALVERHLAGRGQAASRIADAVESAARGRS
jgi:hypothetical protein